MPLPVKAAEPIEITLFGIITFIKLFQEKAPFPIVIKPERKSILSNSFS